MIGGKDKRREVQLTGLSIKQAVRLDSIEGSFMLAKFTLHLTHYVLDQGCPHWDTASYIKTCLIPLSAYDVSLPCCSFRYYLPSLNKSAFPRLISKLCNKAYKHKHLSMSPPRGLQHTCLCSLPFNGFRHTTKAQNHVLVLRCFHWPCMLCLHFNDSAARRIAILLPLCSPRT